jgi:hypothetical protein
MIRTGLLGKPTRATSLLKFLTDWITIKEEGDETIEKDLRHNRIGLANDYGSVCFKAGGHYGC